MFLRQIIPTNPRPSLLKKTKSVTTFSFLESSKFFWQSSKILILLYDFLKLITAKACSYFQQRYGEKNNENNNEKNNEKKCIMIHELKSIDQVDHKDYILFLSFKLELC